MTEPFRWSGDSGMRGDVIGVKLRSAPRYCVIHLSKNAMKNRVSLGTFQERF